MTEFEKGAAAALACWQRAIDATREASSEQRWQRYRPLLSDLQRNLVDELRSIGVSDSLADRLWPKRRLNKKPAAPWERGPP